MISNKNLIRFNFNLKNAKKNTNIKYSFFLKNYLKTINTLKFVNFYTKLTKNRRKFKRKTFKSFSNLLKDRKLSVLLFKQYKINRFLKRKKKKSKSKNTKKKAKLLNQFKSNYYQNYLKKKQMVRKLFFFYVRKKKEKHSQHTNFLKFKNLFLKNGLSGKREILFFNILISLKTLLKSKKIKLIKLLKIVFKRLTFFCELKRKRKFNNELLIPYPVSKRRGFNSQKNVNLLKTIFNNFINFIFFDFKSVFNEVKILKNKISRFPLKPFFKNKFLNFKKFVC